MKKSLVFTLLLLSSLVQQAHACWFYPTGDELRFCFFNAFTDRYPYYSMFNYTSSYFADMPETDYTANSGIDPNIALWVQYCNNKVSAESAAEAVYLTSLLSEHSDNAMIKYLHKMKDYAALEYLKFAKEVEAYNITYDNPWERDIDIVTPKRQGKINAALVRARQAKNPILKSRYYFLAVRLAFYNRDPEMAKKVYDEHFAGKQPATIIDYWSLYFRIAGEKDIALQSYYAAQVFANAPDKRFQVTFYFDNKLPLADIVEHAKNRQEAAAVQVMYAIRKADYALDALKGIYENDSRSEALGFLIVREMNKLEDWIYTPYYSYFSPMLRDSYNEEGASVKLLLERVKDDRQYAAKMLQFVNSVNLDKVKDPEVFRAAKAYLLFMVKDFNGCLSYIASLKPSAKETALQLDRIKALCLTANQQYGAAVIPQAAKTVLLQEKENKKFIFAIGRELEYLGNTTDAALLYAQETDYNISWKAKDQRTPYYDDYYSYYFDYLEGTYSPQAVRRLINAVAAYKSGDPFNDWLYGGIKDINKVYDMLGTKYIRLNRLGEALAAFEKMAPDSRASGYLDDNPFYEMKYTPDFVERRDSITLTKADITRHLIKCIEKGANPIEKDRDYYNFLAANCYYNMTQNGNTWYMRRYYWSSSELTSTLPDEDEYQHASLAKYYYMQAYRTAKTRKFRALCLRLAANCERNKLLYEYYKKDPEERTGTEMTLLYSNVYYKKLAKTYPNYSDEFDSYACYHYKEFFKARR